MPQLFENTSRFPASRSTKPSISADGTPHSPKPPTASVEPSRMSATASAAEAKTLPIDCLPFREHSGAPGAAEVFASPVGDWFSCALDLDPASPRVRTWVAIDLNLIRYSHFTATGPTIAVRSWRVVVRIERCGAGVAAAGTVPWFGQSIRGGDHLGTTRSGSPIGAECGTSGACVVRFRNTYASYKICVSLDTVACGRMVIAESDVSHEAMFE